MARYAHLSTIIMPSHKETITPTNLERKNDLIQYKARNGFLN